MNTQTDAKKLNEILLYTYDSVNGMKECANKINSEKLKYLLLDLAQEKEIKISELKNLIKRLDATPEESGSVTGALHRLYIDLKSLITSGGVDAIIMEVKRGENTLLNAYKELFREDADEAVRQLLKSHVAGIEKGLAKIDQASLTPTSKADDKVDENSKQSFPASDPATKY